jgi:hypothetical protein
VQDIQRRVAVPRGNVPITFTLDRMDIVSSWLPATALVAVVIFMAREVLEASRRSGSERRRKEAFRALLARECELNHWTIRTLQRIAGSLKDLAEPGTPEAFRIEFAKSGRIYACLNNRETGTGFRISIPAVHTSHLHASLLDIATLDKRLFMLAEPALSAVAEVEHVREGLMYHGSTEDEEDRKNADGFAEYAVGELDEAYATIGLLPVSWTPC